MGLKSKAGIMKEAFSGFMRDNAMVLASSLAFYTALSLAPLLMILLAIAGLMGAEAQQALVEQIHSAVGPQAGKTIDMVLRNTSQNRDAGRFAAILSTVMLVFAATGFFIQLQTALNRIWNIRVKKGQAVWKWFRKRAVSLLMVVGIVLIVFLSLIVTTALSVVLERFGPIWQIVNYALSFFIFMLLFAMIYKFLPDVSISWKDVMAGSFVTAVLFLIGRYAISEYLARNSAASAYGAAGSLLIFLLWVYYAALILFFGAELTQVYARHYGKRIQPDHYAERLEAPA